MLWGIGFGSIGSFIDQQSIIIVVGGVLAALVASYPFSVLKKIPRHFIIMAQAKRYSPESCISTLVELGELARRDGLLAQEPQSDGLPDPFFQFAVRSIVDAQDANTLRETLTDQIDNLSQRHEYYIGMYERGSSLAPAFGMVGTLIGLIKMLKSMNLDVGGSSALGESMSVALITTLYGVVVANLIFAPIAKKLSYRNDQECIYKQIILEGVLAIQGGENPKFLREKLYTLVEESRKEKMGEKTEKESKAA